MSNLIRNWFTKLGRIQITDPSKEYFNDDVDYLIDTITIIIIINNNNDIKTMR